MIAVSGGQHGLGGQQGNIGEPADTLPQSGTMLPGMPGYGHAVQQLPDEDA
jgi:hypothetical protein